MFCIKHKYHVFISIASSSQSKRALIFSFVKYSYTPQFYSMSFYHTDIMHTKSIKNNMKSIEYGKIFLVGVIVHSVYMRKMSHTINE